MITITIKIFTDGTFMNMTCHTRKKQSNEREARLAAVSRASLRQVMQKCMLAHKNGIMLSGKNKKLNEQLLERFKTHRRNQTE